MSPDLTPSQAAALDDIVTTCGLQATLHAVAEGFSERIDEFAQSIVDVIDGGASPTGRPLWKKQRGES
jgi:hypothetical protein